MTVTAPPRPNDRLEFQKLEPAADSEALIKEARQRARRQRRIYGAVVALVALVGVAVTVFGRTGQSDPTAASRPSGAGPRAAFQSTVRIELNGNMVPARGRSTITDRGEFTITGAINDGGTYVDHGGYDTVRTLHGRAGTIRITFGPQVGRWEIIGGTKAYAGLHGRGQEAGLYSFDTTDIAMSGTVSGAPVELQAEIGRAEVLGCASVLTPTSPSLRRSGRRPEPTRGRSRTRRSRSRPRPRPRLEPLDRRAVCLPARAHAGRCVGRRSCA